MKATMLAESSKPYSVIQEASTHLTVYVTYQVVEVTN